MSWPIEDRAGDMEREQLLAFEQIVRGLPRAPLPYDCPVIPGGWWPLETVWRTRPRPRPTLRARVAAMFHVKRRRRR